MKRPTKQRLDAIVTSPTHDDLVRVAKLAQQSPGRLFELPFSIPTSSKGSYVICAFFPEPSKEFLAKRGNQLEVGLHWSLLRREELRIVDLWNYVTGDLGLVLNLIATGVSGSAQESNGSLATEKPAQTLPEAVVRNPLTHAEFPKDPEPKPRKSDTDSQQQRAVQLGGNLADVELSSILQSINLCKMTGRLDCFQDASQIEIFFEEGLPVHATNQSVLQNVEGALSGDQVILDLLTWEKGSFQFKPTWTTPERTIKRRLEGLLLEGVTLRDYSKYLTESGLFTDTPFRKVYQSISEAELDDTLQSGVPIDLSVQKQVYGLIGDGTTIEKILYLFPMPKTKWLPIMFNLLNCGLVAVAQTDGVSDSERQFKPLAVDQKAIEVAGDNLLRPATGMLSFPLFLHFLEMQLAMYAVGKAPFSLVMFEVKADDQPLRSDGVKRISEIFASKARKFDLIGHYESFEEFLLLLPYRDQAGACDFVEDFANALSHEDFNDLSTGKKLKVAFGIATVPGDSEHLPVLLAVAVEAKKRCLQAKQTIFAFQNNEIADPWNRLYSETEKSLDRGNSVKQDRLEIPL